MKTYAGSDMTIAVTIGKTAKILRTRQKRTSFVVG